MQIVEENGEARVRCPGYGRLILDKDAEAIFFFIGECKVFLINNVEQLDISMGEK